MKKVYICSSLKLPNVEYVNSILSQLPPAIYLRPRPEELTVTKKQDTVETDVAMMNYCDEIWVLGAFGRDCTWEIGWAAAKDKVVRILRDDRNKETLDNDWMYLHGETKRQLTIYHSIHDFKLGYLND